MTQEQREKLYHILGSIEGLTWGVQDRQISEGFCGVAEDLHKLLERMHRMKMTIDDLKRALVEVREICASTECINCPFHKNDEANVLYCPMHEDDDGITIHQPAFWVVDGWKEDGKDGT